MVGEVWLKERFPQHQVKRPFAPLLPLRYCLVFVWSGMRLGVEMTYLFGLTDSREEIRLSDEETAAVVEAEEQEITDRMLRKYKQLSPGSQSAVRILVNGLWKAERRRRERL